MRPENLASEPAPEFDWVSFYNSVTVRAVRLSACFSTNEWFTYARHGRTLVHARNSKLFGVQFRYTYARDNHLATALSARCQPLDLFLGNTRPPFSEMAGEGFEFTLTLAKVGVYASDICFKEKITFATLRALQEKMPDVEPAQVLGIAVDRLRQLRMGQ